MSESIVVLTLDQIRRIYRERMTGDFPKNELKSLKVIEESMERGLYIGYGCCDGAEILAYALFVRLGRHALLDYYAVRADLRDQGLGSRFLQALIAGPMREMDCVLLEVDDVDRAPDEAERKRRVWRLQFYLRNGLKVTDVCATTYGADFRILALPVGAQMDAQTISRVYSAIYRELLPARVYDEEVEIRISPVP